MASRYLPPIELAALVSTLLVNPDAAGKHGLTPDDYVGFVNDVGNLLSDRFGGKAIGCEHGSSPPENLSAETLADEDNRPYFGIQETEFLKGNPENIFRTFDDQSNADACERKIDSLCAELANARLAAGHTLHFKLPMQDWRMVEGDGHDDPDLQPGDDKEYTAEFKLGNAPSFNIADSTPESDVVDGSVEINKGVPNIRIGKGGDPLIDAFSVTEGYVVNRGDGISSISSAQPSRYTYNEGGAYLFQGFFEA